MSRPRCVITGCNLYADNEEKYAYGDLHQIGDTYILNAVMDPKYRVGETLWLKTVQREKSAGVTVSSEHYYEKRGVIVFNRADAFFNPLAIERMPAVPGGHNAHDV